MARKKDESIKGLTVAGLLYNLSAPAEKLSDEDRLGIYRELNQLKNQQSFYNLYLELKNTVQTIAEMRDGIHTTTNLEANLMTTPGSYEHQAAASDDTNNRDCDILDRDGNKGMADSKGGAEMGKVTNSKDYCKKLKQNACGLLYTHWCSIPGNDQLIDKEKGKNYKAASNILTRAMNCLGVQRNDEANKNRSSKLDWADRNITEYHPTHDDMYEEDDEGMLLPCTHLQYFASDVAKYIIEEYVDLKRPLTLLQLHHMLYLVQEKYLKNYRRKCFLGTFFADENGPIVAELERIYGYAYYNYQEHYYYIDVTEKHYYDMDVTKMVESDYSSLPTYMLADDDKAEIHRLITYENISNLKKLKSKVCREGGAWDIVYNRELNEPSWSRTCKYFGFKIPTEYIMKF